MQIILRYASTWHIISLRTMQESCPFCPAHIIWSVIPPGALDPYVELHLELLHVLNVISCKISGRGPTWLNMPHPTTVAVVSAGTLAP